MTTLERAVDALKVEIGGQSWNDGQWLIDGPFPEADLTAAVRAVLAAIREPSEGMVEAGGEQVLDTEFGAGQYESIADGRGSRVTADAQAKAAWAGMIDAALAEDG